MVIIPKGFNPLCLIVNELKFIGLNNYANLFFTRYLIFDFFVSLCLILYLRGGEF
jgi:hypothetical protein